jgi:ribonuclease P protein component
MTAGLRGDRRRRALVTVRSSGEIDRIFSSGTRSSDDLLTVFVADSPSRFAQSGRLAFIAGRKLGNAVVRNRSKRVLREAARRSGAPWAGHDVMIVARSGLDRASFERIDRSLSRHLGRLGVSR